MVRERSDDAGASAVEYALLIGGVAAVIITVVFLFGTFVGDVFNQSCSTITAQTGPAGYNCDGT